MKTIVMEKVICPGCNCGEVIPVQVVSGAFALGFKRVRVKTDFGSYDFDICVRCQNNMSRLDILRMSIKHHVATRCGNAVALTAMKSFYDYTEKEVESEAWKLIERGAISVDDNGRLHTGWKM